MWRSTPGQPPLRPAAIVKVVVREHPRFCRGSPLSVGVDRRSVLDHLFGVLHSDRLRRDCRTSHRNKCQPMPADHAYPDRDEAWFVTGRVDVDRLQSPDLVALGIDHSVAQPVPEIFCGEHGIRLTPPLRTQTSSSSACSLAKRCILTLEDSNGPAPRSSIDPGGPRTCCGTDLQA